MISPRRILGLAIGLAPFAIVLFSVFSAWRMRCGRTVHLGYGLFALGGMISLLNFYLQVLRYPLHRLRHGKDAKYRWVSGIPLFGLLVVIGLMHLPKSLLLSILAFLFLCIDLGGIQWFVVFTWKDDSLWDPKKHEMEKNSKEP
jgi:hypothetical protein